MNVLILDTPAAIRYFDDATLYYFSKRRDILGNILTK